MRRQMNNGTSLSQNVFMFNRSRVELDGIIDVESFTDSSVIAVSTLGNIAIDGSELKIESFSVESGKLALNGNVDGICYFGRKSPGKKRFSSKKEGK